MRRRLRQRRQRGHCPFVSLHECIQSAQRHLIVLAEHGVDLITVGLDPVLHQSHGFRTIPVSSLLVEQCHVGVLRQNVHCAFGTLDFSGLAGVAVHHQDVALAAELLAM